MNLAARNSAAAAGALVSALVAADTPQLRVLDISFNELGDAGLGPLVAALPQNTRLQELFCINSTSVISAAFARDRLMPALVANTSLLKLDSDSGTANDFITERTTAAAARD